MLRTAPGRQDDTLFGYMIEEEEDGLRAETCIFIHWHQKMAFNVHIKLISKTKDPFFLHSS